LTDSILSSRLPIFRAASSKRNLQTLSRRSFDELRQQAAQWTVLRVVQRVGEGNLPRVEEYLAQNAGWR
jgi:hypothetical protein